MGKLVICDHPLIQHKLTFIRDMRTNTKDFRELVDEVATLMAYEITREVPLESISVQTPVAETQGKSFPAACSAWFRSCAPVWACWTALSSASSGKGRHVGLFRDPETLQPVEYYTKLPTDVTERELIVIDPMLATGGSAIALSTC